MDYYEWLVETDNNDTSESYATWRAAWEREEIAINEDDKIQVQF